MKIRTKQIKIGQALNQNITLPILEIGKGNPSFGIVTGLHGNEPEGLFVIKSLLEQLKNFKGKLKILPGANIFGLIHNQRVNNFDFKDLNRAFPGNKNGSLTERIAFLIFNNSCEQTHKLCSAKRVILSFLSKFFTSFGL